MMMMMMMMMMKKKETKKSHKQITQDYNKKGLILEINRLKLSY